MRDVLVSEMMKLVGPPPRPLERSPTIAELEKILNSESSDDVELNRRERELRAMG